MSVCRLGVGHSPRRSCCIPMGLGAWQLLMAVLDFGPISRCTSSVHLSRPPVCPDSDARGLPRATLPCVAVRRRVSFPGENGGGYSNVRPSSSLIIPPFILFHGGPPCPMAYVMPPEQWQSPARLLSRLSLLLLLPYPFHASLNRPAVPFTRRAYVPPLRSAPRSRSCTPSEW